MNTDSENLRVIATGDGLVNKRHYDIGETRKILGELQVLKDVADGRITYDDALIQLGLKEAPKEKKQTESNNQNYSLSSNVPYSGKSANPNAANIGREIFVNGRWIKG